MITPNRKRKTLTNDLKSEPKKFKLNKENVQHNLQQKFEKKEIDSESMTEMMSHLKILIKI